MRELDNINNHLKADAFSKIGEVVEIDGTKVIVKVDNNKNLSNLFYDGMLYKNVGIGRYLKIKKDYMYMIGKINKEYLKEPSKFVGEKYFSYYDRFVELNIVGYIDNGKYSKGIKELPLLYNEAFLLSETEISALYLLPDKIQIPIGKALFDEIDVFAGVSRLFASHIGIFGNTGSGKSNTLARLYHNLLHFEGINLEKSKIIILDFNGEYTNANTITTDKKCIELCTKVQKDRLAIKYNWLDEEFWGILLQATEKTQKPFIGRSLSLQNELKMTSDSDTLDNIVSHLLKLYKKILSNGVVQNRENEALQILKSCIKKMFNVTDETRYVCIFRYYTNHNGSLCRQYNATYDNGYTSSGDKIYFGANRQANVDQEYTKFSAQLHDLRRNNGSYITAMTLFEVSIGLRFVKDVINNNIQYEHVSPVISRFEKRKKDLERIFDVGERSFTDDQYALQSISLRDVNTDMKKLVPLLITKKMYDEHKEKVENTNIDHTLHLVIDEAHNILSEDSFRESESWKDYRLEVFEEIIKEGRKFGVFLTLSSQRPSDISNTIISQLHNVFIHRLINSNDLYTISKTIAFLDKVSYDSISILPPGACVFTGTATESPIVVEIPLLHKDYQPRSETVNLEQFWFPSQP